MLKPCCEGDEAAQQGGASAEGDGAVQMGTVGVGLEDSTDGTVGLGWGAAEAGAATADSPDMDVDAAGAGAEGSTDTTAARVGVDGPMRDRRRGRKHKGAQSARQRAKKRAAAGMK